MYLTRILIILSLYSQLILFDFLHCFNFSAPPTQAPAPVVTNNVDTQPVDPDLSGRPGQTPQNPVHGQPFPGAARPSPGINPGQPGFPFRDGANARDSLPPGQGGGLPPSTPALPGGVPHIDGGRHPSSFPLPPRNGDTVSILSISVLLN